MIKLFKVSGYVYMIMKVCRLKPQNSFIYDFGLLSPIITRWPLNTKTQGIFPWLIIELRAISEFYSQPIHWTQKWNGNKTGYPEHDASVGGRSLKVRHGQTDGHTLL